MSEPSRFRIIFDGATQITETPDGWQDITSIIKRVKEFNALFITCEAKLTFRDDGYTYLIDKYNEGFCTSVDADLQQYVNGVYRTFFKGKIFLRDAEIQRGECTISVIVEDDTFYAKIFNNKSIEVFPFGEGTKSASGDPTNTDYTLAACAYEKVQMFNPEDGSTIGVLVNPPYSGACYPVYNLFEYLISFMSDNTVAFDSTLFGPGGDYEGLTVTCGIVLRQYILVGTTEEDFKDNFQKISFKQLFEEVNKKVNIGMYVDYSNPLPVLRIERASDVRTEATMFRALKVEGIKEKVDVDALYSTVRLGSNTTVDAVVDPTGPDLNFPENISFAGPKEEQFFVLSNCNLDKELNLVSDWIISSNVIQDCLMRGEDSYDEDLIFIMCDVSGGTYTARQQNLSYETGVFPVYYNLDLFGPVVMANYFGAVPLAIATSLGNDDNSFKASLTTNQSGALPNTYTTIIFDDDSTGTNFDTNANYNPANGRFTVPTNGLYSFEVFIAQFLIDVNTIVYGVGYYLEHYDSGMNLINRYPLGAMGGYGYSSATYSQSVVGDATDIIIVTYRETGSPVQILADSYYKCGNTEDGGGVYHTFDPADYPVILHEWEYPLTYDDFETIEQNQTGQIEFSRHNEVHYSGWIDSVKFKRFSDEKAKFVTYRAKRVPVTANQNPTIQYVNVVGQLGSNPYDITTDFYSQPFGGSGTTEKTHFYLVGQDVTITIPSTYLTLPTNPAVAIAITKFSGSTSVLTTYTQLSVTFTIEYGYNYIVQPVYSLTELGKTRPSVLPEITPPAAAGQNGTLNIRCVSPSNPADYTFSWNTGAVTQSITGPAGFYQCTVTNTNPGTYDINTIVFDLEIPISVTGQ